MTWTPFGLSPEITALIGAVILGAAFIRGYSGFGYAALTIAAASILADPRRFAPVVIVCEVIVGAQLLPSVWREIDWRRAGALVAGAFVGVPVGVIGLARLDVTLIRIAISIYLLIMCALFLGGWRLRRPARLVAHVGVGFFSGIANGAAIGGLPVAAFFAAQPMPAAMFRATLVAYFLALDVWSLPFMGGVGQFDVDSLIVTGAALPLLLLGVWLGGRHFMRSDPQSFRHFAILLLAGLALLGLARTTL